MVSNFPAQAARDELSIAKIVEPNDFGKRRYPASARLGDPAERGAAELQAVHWTSEHWTSEHWALEHLFKFSAAVLVFMARPWYIPDVG